MHDDKMIGANGNGFDFNQPSIVVVSQQRRLFAIKIEISALGATDPNSIRQSGTGSF
jgi:hypothetical protein